MSLTIKPANLEALNSTKQALQADTLVTLGIRKPLRSPNPRELDVIESTLQHLAVQERNGIESEILRVGGDVAIDSEMGQKALYISLINLLHGLGRTKQLVGCGELANRIARGRVWDGLEARFAALPFSSPNPPNFRT